MENERLMFCINRFDHYYDSVNNKNSVILGLSTFIIGGLLSLYNIIKNIENLHFVSELIYFSSIGLGLLAMIIMIIAATPYLKSQSKSLNSFISISKMSKSDFLMRSELVSENEERNDLRTQTYILSKGLWRKFFLLRIACIIITIQFFLIIPTIILLINNLN